MTIPETIIRSIFRGDSHQYVQHHENIYFSIEIDLTPQQLEKRKKMIYNGTCGVPLYILKEHEMNYIIEVRTLGGKKFKKRYYKSKIELAIFELKEFAISLNL